MIYLPAVTIGFAALVIGIVNLAYFRKRPAWSGAALAFAGALGTAAAAAEHAWWFAALQLALTAWGLAFLVRAAPGPPPPDPAGLNDRMAEAFTEWAKREGMPGTATEAQSFMAGYVKGRADLRAEKGARR